MDVRKVTEIRAVLLVGAFYAIVGIVFAIPAGHVRAWRLAAWVVSGVGYAIHLGYERFRLRNSFRRRPRNMWEAKFCSMDATCC